MRWKLDRPAPALPNSYFWTWDHSTNWVLDDPGLQNRGCYNRYLKRPETFVEDYRRLTDLAAGLGVRGIVIWGFLRDSHGGIEFGKRVAGYAASKGVAVMPGVGTTWYGGVYYEGDHPFSLPVFLAKNPDARMLAENGEPRAHGACPVHPRYHEWLRQALEWLYREFEIGGVNLENGDMLVDHHPLTQAARKDWPVDDPEPFFFQGLSYKQALDAIGGRLSETLGTYATYTGFSMTDGLAQNAGMGRKPPAMLTQLPPQSICQWTLTGMIRDTPLPLTEYLDEGAPQAAFDNPGWPEGLMAPAPRNVGFLHQGSQWHEVGRYRCIVSHIKEGCLRAFRSGLEGVSIHGEVSNRYIPWALNYLAFSHFIHWPEDNLREFGRKTLSRVLGSEEEGEAYATILAHWDAGDLSDQLLELASPAAHGFDRREPPFPGDGLDAYERYRFWQWLYTAVPTRHMGSCEQGTDGLDF